MPHAKIDGCKLYFAESRSPGKPLLLMVHGSGGSHRHWPESLRRSADLHALAIDLPGHGRSAGSGYSLVGNYADVVESFVERLGLSGVTLAGHSLGGAIALTLAIRRPEWLAGMVLVGTGSRLRVLPAILEGLSNDPVATLRFIWEMMFARGVPPVFAKDIRDEFMNTPPGIVLGDLNACNRFDVTDDLKKIDCPALIVSASEDRLTPVKYGEFLHKRIRGAQMALIEGAGHMMTLEAPKEVAGIIGNFVGCRRPE